MLELGETLATLALTTKNKPLEDDAAAAYFDGLQDVPLPTLQAAVGRLIRRVTWFPSVAEIRAECDVGGRAFQTFVPPPITPLRDDDPRLWYACVTCQDSGWASSWCPGSVQAQPPHPEMFLDVAACGSNACARFGVKGYGHEFVRRCSCYEHNPRIRERLEARRMYAGHEK